MPRVLNTGFWAATSGGGGCTCCTGTPSLLGSYQIDTHLYTGGGTPYGQATSNPSMATYLNYVFFLATSLNSGDDYYKLYVLDVSNPASVSVVSTLSLTYRSGGNYFRPYYTFIRDGKWLYVVGIRYTVSPFTQNTEAHIFDISDPASPSESYNWTMTGNKLCDVVRDGYFKQGTKHYIVGGDFNSGYLRVLDITNVSTFSEVGTYAFTEIADAYSYKDGLVFAMEEDPANGWADTLLRIIDVSDPTTPTLIGSLDLSSYITYEDAPPLVDNYTLWVADIDGTNLIGVNIDDPTTPTYLSTTTASGGPGFLVPCGDGLLYSLNYAAGGKEIQGVNIADETAPTTYTAVSVPANAFMDYANGCSTLILLVADTSGYPSLLIYST